MCSVGLDGRACGAECLCDASDSESNPKPDSAAITEPHVGTHTGSNVEPDTGANAGSSDA